MATATVTITAKTGPAVANTAKVISNVKSIILDFDKQTITVNQGNIGGPGEVFDMADTATITDTIAGVGLGHTIAISS